MPYVDEIERLIESVDPSLANFAEERKRSSAPTQVSSEFLTNKEQGDWAEKTLLKAINGNSDRYIAVKYGRDDDIVAGEPNFKEFYELYQDELDEIGKRPDILIFAKEDFTYNTDSISNFDRGILDELVPKAKCGIEVRSSAFSIDAYEENMRQRKAAILEQKNNILTNYGELLFSKKEELYRIIENMTIENIHETNYRVPSWKSSEQLRELSVLLKDLKHGISEMNKRTYLSITPKVEDLKVVYTWIQKYKVPHYYVQVFFDKAYGISFKKIMELIGDPERENIDYFIERDIKNQNKITIKIRATSGENILDRIVIPSHHSEMKELGRGRMLFYVKFDESESNLNKEAFERLFEIDL